jgi:hypothetical protein
LLLLLEGIKRLSPRTRPAGLQRNSGTLGKCSSCDVLQANLKVKVRGDEMETETESHGWGEGVEGPGGERPRWHARRPAETRGCDRGPSCMATLARDQCSVGKGSIVAVEKGQVVWSGTRATQSAMLSAGGCCGGATSVQRGQGQGGAKQRSKWSRGETDTGGAEHTRGKGPCPSVRQQRRGAGKDSEVGNGREPTSR